MSAPRNVETLNKELAQRRAEEIKKRVPTGENQWSSYPQRELTSPGKIDK